MLKPCPFCGEKANLDVTEEFLDDCHTVKCYMCGAVSGCGVADAMCQMGRCLAALEQRLSEMEERLDEHERVHREHLAQLDQMRKESYSALHYDF